MVFSSPFFLCFALTSIVILRISLRGPAFPVVACVLNIAFVYLFFGLVSSCWLLAVVAFGFVLFLGAQRFGRAAQIAGVVLLVALFIVMKRYPFVPEVPALQSIPAIIGLSFLIFRLIHLVVDAADGRVRPMTPFDFIAYTLFFPTLLSGPVQRYQDFVADRPAAPPGMRDLTRVVLGYLKVTVVSPILLAIHTFSLTKRTNLVWLGVDLRTVAHHLPADKLSQWMWLAASIFAAMVWFIYLYYNFSGYTDIVIGLARLAGLGLPENFNHPFAANSFLEFWNRWHMSLAQWFRIYVFGPLFKFLVMELSWPGILLNALGLFVTFFLVGVWHGTTWSFLVCGVFLGTGAAVNRSYRDLMSRYLGRNGLKKLDSFATYQYASFGLTFLFLTISITPLWMSDDQFLTFLRAFNGSSLLLLPLFFISATVGIGALRICKSRLIVPAARGYRRLVPSLNADLANAIIVAVLVNLIVITNAADLRQLPTFIYQGF